MATEYNINYDDQRFKDVEADKKAAVNEVEKTYGEMIGKTDEFYNAQINASKEWADKQTQLQQEKTDFAIEQIEQQKEQAKKDYTKEQQGAYVDWQKQKNDYGTNAEQQAQAGLASSGYAESSQVSYYNTYQNRVMTARESYNNAVLNYNNAIKDARLQNNSVLAEIAYNALQKQLELSLAGFQYKNQLLLDKASKKTEMENIYYSRYQDVLSQINTENALAEQIRQHNDEMAFQREQFEWQKEQTKKKSGGGSSYSGGGGGGGGGGGDDTTPQVKGGTPQTKDGRPIKPSEQATLNAGSVLALGQGPRSGSWVAEQEAKGNIGTTTRNGQVYVYNKKLNTGKATKYYGGGKSSKLLTR